MPAFIKLTRIKWLEDMAGMLFQISELLQGQGCCNDSAMARIFPVKIFF